MSHASLCTVGTWSAPDTTVAAVNAALSRIRRCEERAAVRATVMTLVVVTTDRAEADRVLPVVYGLGGRHPAHALILVLEPGPAPRLDAEVRVHCVERGGRAVAFEDLLLRVHGPLVDHLDSLIEPFTLPDLPVVVWLGSGPRLQDPLLGSADRLIVDSGRPTGHGGPGGYDPGEYDPGGYDMAELAMVARRLPVTDLAWIRLVPWRALLACVVDEDAWRYHLDTVCRASVAGDDAARRLLAGWIVSRLEPAPPDVRLVDASVPAMELVAERGGSTARAEVLTDMENRKLIGTAEITGRSPRQYVWDIPDASIEHVLGEALGAERDDVYEAALTVAATLA